MQKYGEGKLLFVSGDEHASDVNIDILGSGEEPFVTNLAKKFEIEKIDCAHSGENRIKCTVVHSGSRNTNFIALIGSKNSETKLEKTIEFQNYLGAFVRDIKISEKFTVMETAGENSSGLLVYSNDKEKYLYWAIPQGDYKNGPEEIYYEVQQESTGETYIFVLTRVTQNEEEIIKLKKFELKEWGIESQEDGQQNEVDEAKLIFYDEKNQIVHEENLKNLYKGSGGSDDDKDPKNKKSFLRRHWFLLFFILTLVLLMGVVGYFFMRKKRIKAAGNDYINSEGLSINNGSMSQGGNESLM